MPANLPLGGAIRPPIPFHASAIRAGRGFWRGVSEEQRQSILDDVVAAITATDGHGGLRLYAAAIEKDSELYGGHAVEAATEQVCKRFDTFLTRRYRERRDPQRGLLIFSEGRFDARAKLWVKGFRRSGTQWGSINNLYPDTSVHGFPWRSSWSCRKAKIAPPS